MKAKIELRRGTCGDRLYPVLTVTIERDEKPYDVDLRMSSHMHSHMIAKGHNPLDFLANIQFNLEELVEYRHKFLEQIEQIQRLEMDNKALTNIVESLTEQLELLQQQGD